MASNQARFEKLIGSINKRFDRAAQKWEPGGTADWQEEMSDILYSGHAGAWRIGANQAGGQASRAEIAAAAAQAADEQSFYLNRFAADLDAGKYTDPETGDIDHAGISTRAQMYSGAMRGTANLSWLNYSEDDDEFDWVLGAVEDHCDDCPYLAEGSPYTKDTLPTVPGENQTPCLFHCKCHLRRLDGVQSIFGVGEGEPQAEPNPAPSEGDKVVIPQRSINSEAKLKEYALNPAHPVGGSKSKYFAAIGYTQSNWEEFRHAIQAMVAGKEADVVAGEYGPKAVLSGYILSFDGKSRGYLRVVVGFVNGAWRLITIVPGRKAK